MSLKIKKSTSFLFIVSAGIFFLFALPRAHASTYYVANNGSDNNNGTSTSTPFQTIQKSLNTVKAGDTVDIEAGTYNESLTLVANATQSNPITITNYNGGVVTINSGNSVTLKTNGAQNYYNISNLNLVASTGAGAGTWTVDFANGAYVDKTTTSAGNDGFTISNCNITGSMQFYGHFNVVTHSTFNGLSSFQIGIKESFGASHDNIFSYNTIHDYTSRGIWSMQYVSNTQALNNTVYNIGDMAIDFDGAANHDSNCVARGNTIYSYTNGGIILEDALASVIDSNTVYGWNGSGDGTGIGAINYGPPETSVANGGDGLEYRNNDTHSVISNNLIEGAGKAGVGITTSPGNKIYNNTIYNTINSSGSFSGWFAAISLNDDGTNSTFYDEDTSIENNIVYGWGSYGVWIYEPSGGLTGLSSSNNIYYDPSKTNVYHSTNYGNETLTAYKSRTGKETSSLFANPLFVSLSNFYLQSTSPAINAGANLASAGVTEDINGTARPQGSGFDIGAYEYISSSGCTPLTFNSGSASPTQVAANVTYNISCNYGITAVDSVEASNDLGSCTWLNWNGNTANFSCNAGSIGTRTNTCVVAAGTTANSCAQQNSINSVSVISSVNSIPPAAPSGLSLQ